MDGCFFCDQQAGRRALTGGVVYGDALVCATHMVDAAGPSYLGYLAALHRLQATLASEAH